MSIRKLTLAAALSLIFGAAAAQDLPPEVETIPAGPDNGHLPLDYVYDYGMPFPTSGPHSPRWTSAGLAPLTRIRRSLIGAPPCGCAPASIGGAR